MGALLINIVWWTGVYTIGKNVFIPVIQGVRDGVREYKEEKKQQKT